MHLKFTKADQPRNQTVLLGEASGTAPDGDWISAATDLYNTTGIVERSGDARRRILVVDEYRGGGFQQPYGWHYVTFAVYDDAQVRYLYDERVRLEIAHDRA
jgi:hypothetical protein